MPLLKLIFGQVEPAVMDAAQIYFFFTTLSFPFIALYDAGSSVYRAQGNTKAPMTIAVVSNGLNICGNAVLIWGFKMGVTGATLATLGSRIFPLSSYLLFEKKTRLLSSGIISKSGRIYIKIRMILAVGIPNGIENAMFQFGKLAIQSTVSTMGTIAIAAQAMTKYYGESERHRGYRYRHRPDDGRRAVHGAGRKEGGGLLY